MVEKLYAADIEGFFDNSRDKLVIAVDLDVTSETGFMHLVRDLVQSVFKIRQLDTEEDFFAAGLDSLQAIQLSRALLVSLEKAGIKVSKEAAESRVIYAHPTVTQLAAYAFSLVSANHRQGSPTNGSGVMLDRRPYAVHSLTSTFTTFLLQYPISQLRLTKDKSLLSQAQRVH